MLLFSHHQLLLPQMLFLSFVFFPLTLFLFLFLSPFSSCCFRTFVFLFFGGSFQDPLFSPGPFFSLQPSPLSSHGFLEEMSSILFVPNASLYQSGEKMIAFTLAKAFAPKSSFFFLLLLFFPFSFRPQSLRSTCIPYWQTS